MFKRIQKKTGSARTRDDDDEVEAPMEDSSVVMSRKPLNQQRRGMMHQGGHTMAQMLTSHLEEEEKQEVTIDVEMLYVPDSEEQKREVDRARELRQQRRKDLDAVPVGDGHTAEEGLQMHLVEAQWLKSKILKERYGDTPQSVQTGTSSSNVKDMDAGSEDEEEVEAFIKKRVKEGSGKEYDQIVRKELITYRGSSAHENDFQEFTKYEAGRAYKAVAEYMEAVEDPAAAIGKEIEALEVQIASNEAKVAEMVQQEVTSEAMVVQAEA